MEVTVPVASPPRRPESEPDVDLETRVDALEALIEEARRRARRRHRVYGAIALAGLGAAVWASFGIGGSGGISVGRSASDGPAALTPQAHAARWRSLGGPEGGGVSGLAIDPVDSRILYADGWDTVFKSTNGGVSWKDTTDDRGWQEGGPIAIDPTHPGTVYVGSDRGVAKTVDGGRHWRKVNTGLFDRAPLPPAIDPPNGSAIGSLTIDAQHPATVYAATGRGLFRTRNGGARWREIASPLPRHQMCGHCSVWGDGYAMSFAIDPNHAQTIYAAWARYSRAPKPSELFVSRDGGDSWRRIATTTPISISALALTASGALLATDQSQIGVFRSSDGGATWRPAGLSNGPIAALSVDPGSAAIYATTNNGKAVFRTTDGGSTWQPASANLALAGAFTDPSNPATVYATTNDGVVKSADHGQTWAAADKGIVSTFIPALAFVPGDPATLYAGTDDGRVFTSTDGGRAWRGGSALVAGWTRLTALAVEPHRARTILAGTPNGLFESTDAGAHWSRIQTGSGNYIQTLATDPRRSSTIYLSVCKNRIGCYGYGTFLKSVDGGATWRKIIGIERITGVPRAVASIAVDPERANVVFAGTNRGGLYRSTDAGGSWRHVGAAHGDRRSHLDSPGAIVAIAIDPRNDRNIYAAVQTGGILKSSDGGTTWGTANAGLANLDMYALAIDPHNPETLFASTFGGVFRSGNGGQSWQLYNRGLPAGGVASFAIDPARRILYAGTNGAGVEALALGG
jgi:photosystem II stability/assembly factor-like uncharacterized protein